MPNLTGQSIGRYHILEQLGEGGMATVYKAYDTRLERNVAFKVLRTDLFGQAILDQVLKRFEREAKSLAKLSHPNIVNILDYGEYEGNPYLVMEFLTGGTLKEKLGHAIPWQETIQTLIPVARGLSYAHQHSVIHRDVKPANILMKEGNIPVLTDFGIAKLLEGTDGHTLTASGVGIGTPEYMAPEQGIGASTIDTRADIYSLGVVLYEMITGRKPYIADTPMAVVIKQINDPLPRPTDFVPDLPEGVEHILFKALAKEPSDRYGDMDAFISAMEGILKNVQTAEITTSPTDENTVQKKEPKDISHLSAQTIASQPSETQTKRKRPFFTSARGLLTVFLVVVLGTGGYFAWLKWGSNLSFLFNTDESLDKACFIMTSNDDRSNRNSAIWQGILNATKNTKLQTKIYLSKKSSEETQGTLDTMFKEDCIYVVGNGEWLKEPFLKNAKEKPDIFFVPVDVSYSGTPRPLPENLIEQTFDVHGGAFLAGYLAAGLTQTGKVGTFGGEQTDSAIQFMGGFVDGIQRYNLDHDAEIEVYGWDPETRTGSFAEDFYNRDAHTLQAMNLIQKEIDIIFIVSTLDASQDIFSSGVLTDNREVKIISTGWDWKSSLAATGQDYLVFASVIKEDGLMVAEALGQLVSGNYDNTQIIGRLDNGGVAFIYNDATDNQLKTDLDRLWEEIAGVSKSSLDQNSSISTTQVTALDLIETNRILWAESPHADKEAFAFTRWNDSDPAEIQIECAKCHSMTGFQDYLGADGSLPESVDASVPAGEVLECGTCHLNTDAYEIRGLESVLFSSGARLSFSSNNPNNLCISCHQGRSSKNLVDENIGINELDTPNNDLVFQNPHYGLAGANLFGTEAGGAYEYTERAYAGRYPHVDTFNDCTDCHDPHSTTLNLEICMTCHYEGSFNSPADLRQVRMPDLSYGSRVDYDGDGDVSEGIYGEIETLKQFLLPAIQTYSRQHTGKAIGIREDIYPYFYIDTNRDSSIQDDEAISENRMAPWTPRLLRAAYNYLWVVKDQGNYTHNPHYTIQILYDTLDDLGADVSTMRRP